MIPFCLYFIMSHFGQRRRSSLLQVVLPHCRLGQWDQHHPHPLFHFNSVMPTLNTFMVLSFLYCLIRFFVIPLKLNSFSSRTMRQLCISSYRIFRIRRVHKIEEYRSPRMLFLNVVKHWLSQVRARVSPCQSTSWKPNTINWCRGPVDVERTWEHLGLDTLTRYSKDIKDFKKWICEIIKSNLIKTTVKGPTHCTTAGPVARQAWSLNQIRLATRAILCREQYNNSFRPL